MFGPDTPLVIDALQIAGLAAAAGVGAVMLAIRLRKKRGASPEPKAPTPLEERVRVLERIATDRTQDLADEIEALREPATTNKKTA